MEGFSTLFLSMPETTTAEDIAKALILRELAAWISIVPEVKTVGASRKYGVKSTLQVLMIIKTLTEKVEGLIEFVKINSPFEQSKLDIISAPNGKANILYLEWMKEIEEDSD